MENKNLFLVKDCIVNFNPTPQKKKGWFLKFFAGVLGFVAGVVIFITVVYFIGTRV